MSFILSWNQKTGPRLPDEIVRSGCCVTHCLQTDDLSAFCRAAWRRRTPVQGSHSFISTKTELGRWRKTLKCRAEKKTTSFWSSRSPWIQKKWTLWWQKSARLCSCTTIAPARRCRVYTVSPATVAPAPEDTAPSRAPAPVGTRGGVAAAFASAAETSGAGRVPTTYRTPVSRTGTIWKRGTEKDSTLRAPRTTPTSSSRNSYCPGTWLKKRFGDSSSPLSRSTTSLNKLTEIVYLALFFFFYYCRVGFSWLADYTLTSLANQLDKIIYQLTRWY